MLCLGFDIDKFQQMNFKANKNLRNGTWRIHPLSISTISVHAMSASAFLSNFEKKEYSDSGCLDHTKSPPPSPLPARWLKSDYNDGHCSNVVFFQSFFGKNGFMSFCEENMVNLITRMVSMAILWRQ